MQHRTNDESARSSVRRGHPAATAAIVASETSREVTSSLSSPEQCCAMRWMLSIRHAGTRSQGKRSQLRPQRTNGLQGLVAMYAHVKLQCAQLRTVLQGRHESFVRKVCPTDRALSGIAAQRKKHSQFHSGVPAELAQQHSLNARPRWSAGHDRLDKASVDQFKVERARRAATRSRERRGGDAAAEGPADAGQRLQQSPHVAEAQHTGQRVTQEHCSCCTGRPFGAASAWARRRDRPSRPVRGNIQGVSQFPLDTGGKATVAEIGWPFALPDDSLRPPRCPNKMRCFSMASRVGVVWRNMIQPPSGTSQR
jgi:hypothetical protein